MDQVTQEPQESLTWFSRGRKVRAAASGRKRSFGAAWPLSHTVGPLQVSSHQLPTLHLHAVLPRSRDCQREGAVVGAGSLTLCPSDDTLCPTRSWTVGNHGILTPAGTVRLTASGPGVLPRNTQEPPSPASPATRSKMSGPIQLCPRREQRRRKRLPPAHLLPSPPSSFYLALWSQRVGRWPGSHVQG